MIYTTKRFSKGGETAKQKQDREAAVTELMGSCALLGGGLGMMYGTRKNGKILDKASKIASKAHNQTMQILDAKIKTNLMRMKGAKPRNQKEADMLKYYLDKSNHYIDVNDRGRKRVFKTAEKMTKNLPQKNGLKGAVIGAAVAAPIAYVLNKAMKKANSREKNESI